MKKIISIVGVLIIVAAGFFGGKALGLFGGEKTLSKEEISEVLAAHALEIEAEGGLAYGNGATLVSAIHRNVQITIRGDTTRDVDTLKQMFGDDYAAGYMATRESMAAIGLCGDVTMRAALAGGAYFVYNWFAPGNERLGGVKVRGETYCVDRGYLKANSGE